MTSPDGVSAKTMLELLEHERGTLLDVRARAGGRKNGVTGIRQGALMVSVTQVAEKGKANRAIIALLAKLLGCGKHQVELLRGATSPHKQFLVHDLSAQEISEAVGRALEASS